MPFRYKLPPYYSLVKSMSWILSILLLCHQSDISMVDGFVPNVRTKSFTADHHYLQSSHIARTYYFPIKNIDKRNIVVTKANEGKSEDEVKETNEVFSFLSSTLDA